MSQVIVEMSATEGECGRLSTEFDWQMVEREILSNVKQNH